MIPTTNHKQIRGLSSGPFRLSVSITPDDAGPVLSESYLQSSRNLSTNSMVQYFNVDLSYLKDPESGIVPREVDSIPSAVFVARGRGGILLPIGCSAISVPVDARCAEGYWYAGLFRLPHQPIIKLDRKILFECIACFLPYLIERRMIVQKISAKCFFVEDRRYKLFLPGGEMCMDASQHAISQFRTEIAKLLPLNERFKHALMKTTDMYSLSNHPAHWSVDQDMYFLTAFVTNATGVKLWDLKDIIISKNWATNEHVAKDIKGENKFWRDHPHMPRPKYDTDSAEDLNRYIRNKSLHFWQLDPELQKVFGDPKHGLLAFGNSLVHGGDLPFSLWEAMNKRRLKSMQEFWF